MKEIETISTQVLVIGAGCAGMRAALEAKLGGADVHLIVKGCFAAVGMRGAGASANGLCEGGGVLYGSFQDRGFDPRNPQTAHPSTEDSYNEALRLGLGAADPSLVRILVEDSTRNLRDLTSFGIYLNRGFGWGVRAHGVPLAGGLAAQLRGRGVAIRDGLMVTRLLVHDGTIAGAIGIDETSGNPVVIQAGAVILAAGGVGRLFRHNFNPPCVTGDGYAMGFEAGAELMNLEFHQVGMGIVYPTRNTLYFFVWPNPPDIINARVEAFLDDYVPSQGTIDQVWEQRWSHGPASTRDPLSRYLEEGIIGEVKAGRGTRHDGVWFDVRGQKALPGKSVEDWYHYRGVYPETDRLEVSVCHHCSNGGFRVDADAQTTVPGLYAVGECMAGAWGADRRGGHMLAGTQVFGARAGRHAARFSAGEREMPIPEDLADEGLGEVRTLSTRKGSLSIGELRDRLTRGNWLNLLWCRSHESLDKVLSDVDQIRGDMEKGLNVESPVELVEAWELRNMLLTTEMIARTCLAREESRGPHNRTDYPEQNDESFSKAFTLKKGPVKMIINDLDMGIDWKDPQYNSFQSYRWG